MDARRDEFDLPAPVHPRAALAARLELTDATLERADRACRNSGQPLAVALSLLGLAGEERIAQACADLYDAPVWPSDRVLERTEPPGVNALFLQDRYAVALDDGDGGWRLGLVDPGDETTVSALRFALGEAVAFNTLTLSTWRKVQGPEPQSVETSTEAADSGVSSAWLDDAERLKDIARDAPAVRMVDRLLERAFLIGASDVHVEQKIDHARVRFRIDGALQDQERLPVELGPAVIARVKVLSDLDVAERRAPQDGRTTISVRGAPVDVRISTAPTVFGESLVVRLLTRRGIDYDLDRLGLRPSVANGLRALLGRTHGLLLVTGPTGSGKTTTLYAALRELASTRTKILTVEDPVEYVFEDIAQSQVNEAAGFGFSTALRAFLRHDPDVILVGEIRDAETARLAVQASLTGHLVLSTVHTNDAASTPSRLIDMGVERYLLADALIGVMAQRLAPQVCPDCATTRPLSREERERLTSESLAFLKGRPARAVGCPGCGETGRLGRRAVSELLVCDAEVGELISRGASAEDLRALQAARPEGVGLRQDALEQSLAGFIDWDDAWRAADR